MIRIRQEELDLILIDIFTSREKGSLFGSDPDPGSFIQGRIQIRFVLTVESDFSRYPDPCQLQLDP